MNRDFAGPFIRASSGVQRTNRYHCVTEAMNPPTICCITGMDSRPDDFSQSSGSLCDVDVVQGCLGGIAPGFGGRGPLICALGLTTKTRMVRFLSHAAIFAVLTLLTQVGGIAWLLACAFRRKGLAFGVVYVALTIATVWVAPLFGRVALSCFERGPLVVQSWVYCALNRNYVTPELAEVLRDTAADMERRHPGTRTVVLDANFPFLDGFPLLPHLSHDDGEKADLAFYYADASGYLPGAVRSPIGYFAFEQGPTHCPQTWPTLRWDFEALQPLWRAYHLEPERNRAVLDVLSEDPRVGRIFAEPHLVTSLGAASDRIGFQGCRAARHDDHIHMQLR